MKPSYWTAACWQVQATCITPLRSGPAERDMEQILRDHTGCAMIQGSSIAGALRAWLENAAGPLLAKRLFGYAAHPGCLTVSDAMFEPDTRVSIRPRVHISAATGTVEGTHKFDMAHVEAGSRFSFQLTWRGGVPDADSQTELETVKDMLSALSDGLIRLGGQKSNGFGRVRLDDVRYRLYDMRVPQDRQDWSDRADPITPLALTPLQDTRQVVFTLDGDTDRILVRSGQRAGRGGQKGSSTVNIRAGQTPIVPGSSIKGSVLNQVRTLGEYLHIPKETLNEALGRGANRNGERDNGLAGRFYFEDAFLENDAQEISRIRINRFTGGVMDRGLFREENLKSKITLRITAPENYPVICALLLYSLRDLGLGLYNLGSGWNVGRGRIRVKTVRARLDQKTITLRFDQNGGCTLEDPDGLAAQWMDSLGGARHDS